MLNPPPHDPFVQTDLMIRAEHVSREYLSGGQPLEVLKDISIELEMGGFLAITGTSGSGKTTLLGLLAGLDQPSSGRIWLAGTEMGPLDEDERARFRRRNVGFVFQSFQLIPTLTASENVQVPLELAGIAGATATATALLERVGLGARGHHYPSQLSGGEQQRVAVARAFSTKPAILFADEPTGNLDEANGQLVIDLLLSLNAEYHTTLVLVSHDPAIATLAHHTIRLASGGVVEESSR